jgi:hypothetical protein
MKKNESKLAAKLAKMTAKKAVKQGKQDAKTTEQASYSATKSVLDAQEADRKVSLLKRLDTATRTTTPWGRTLVVLAFVVAIVATAIIASAPEMTPEQLAAKVAADYQARIAIAAQVLDVPVEEMVIRIGPIDDIEDGLEELFEAREDAMELTRDTINGFAMVDPPQSDWYNPWSW